MSSLRTGCLLTSAHLQSSWNFSGLSDPRRVVHHFIWILLISKASTHSHRHFNLWLRSKLNLLHWAYGSDRLLDIVFKYVPIQICLIFFYIYHSFICGSKLCSEISKGGGYIPVEWMYWLEEPWKLILRNGLVWTLSWTDVSAFVNIRTSFRRTSDERHKRWEMLNMK